MSRKIVLTHNTTRYLELHYGEFIQGLQERGYEVVIVAPVDAASARFAAQGVRCIDLALSRRGINPLVELGLLLRLRAIFAAEHPDIVLNFSIKPIIYGSLAAWSAGVRHILSMVTGLGYVFAQDSWRQRILRFIVTMQYRFALRRNARVFFQNPDDRTFFVRTLALDPARAVALDGSGIDTRRFVPGAAARPGTFLLVARLLWDKGIREYVDAARLLKAKYPHAEFRLLGPYDDNPAAVDAHAVAEWERAGLVSYLGEAADVRPYIEQAAVFVLPSYREGMPRAVLEAMAMAKPVVTTDVPGCREAVRDGVNGFLVPARDAQALAAALERFLLEPGLAAEMGRRSRAAAIERFEIGKVNGVVYAALAELVHA